MERTIIIAEAGVNHNGSLDTALKMIDAAKEAGADIVKFQTAKPEKVISRYADKAEYQKETTGAEESQLEMCKRIHLRFDDYKVLKSYCEKVGIQFLSTPFDLDSIAFLEELGCSLWKVPSGEITNLPYLEKIAQTRKEVILSTGMSDLEEVRAAVNILKDGGATKISLLHCNTQYPTPYRDVNLKAMLTLRDTFHCSVGYSDHTLGIEVPIAAVAMGASIIEKHFGSLPQVSQFDYYDVCRQLTEDIRLEQFYSDFLIELKKRNPINKELFAAVPYELKFLVYFMNFKPKDYDALAQFLQK